MGIFDRRLKRTGAVLGATVVTVALLTACGGLEPPAETADPSTVSFLAVQGNIPQQVIDDFEAANPNITVDFQEAPAGDPYKQLIRNLTQTGDLPDVFENPTGPDATALWEADVLAPWSDALAGESYDGGATWLSTLDENLLKASTGSIVPVAEQEEGVYYYIPLQVTGIQVLYNKDQYEELGLDVPETWQDFLDNNDEILASGRSAIAPGKVDWWAKIAWDQTAPGVTAADVASGEYPMDSPGIVEGLQEIADLFKAGYFPQGTLSLGPEEEQGLFLAGALTQYMHIQSTASLLMQNAPFEIGSYTLPAIKGEPLHTMGGATSTLALNAEGNQEGAVLLAKYLTSPEVAAFRGETQFAISALSEKPQIDNEVYNNYSESVLVGGIVAQTWFQPLTAEQNADLNQRILLEAYSGALSPEDAAAQIEQLFETSRQ